MKGSFESAQQKGKGCAMIVMGFFALMGIAMTIAFTVATWNGLRSQFWDPTPCTILTSALKEETKKSYVVDVSYHYVFGGKEYTGTKLKPSGNSFDNATDAQRALREYRSDQQKTCYVNASAPTESVLERASPFQALAILFPLIFVAIGVGGIILLARRKSGSSRALSSRRANAVNGALILRLMGIVFTLVGATFGYFFAVRPWLEVRESANWREVPCVITSSKVESHSDSDGTTYSVAITYDYTVDGEKYMGTRYNFATASSNTRDWRQRAVKANPRGKQTVCFVNPNDPLDSVLVRETGLEWWFGFLPGIFLLVGIGMLFGAGKVAAQEKRSTVPKSASPDPAAGGLRGSIAENSGPVILKPSESRVGGFILLLIIALIWNGIVWGMLMGGNLPTAAKVFLSIFALIGGLLALGAVHQFLALFNPRPTLRADASSVRLGETLQVHYQFEGQTQRIERLSLTLTAEEAATYRRGTDTTTDKSPFFRQVLLETKDRAQLANGTVRIEIPANSMHSFDAPNNKITWRLELHGEIRRWPDVKCGFEIIVLPAALPLPEPATT